jgi:hypothetical protein
MTSLFTRAKTLTVLAFSAGVAFAAPTIEIGTWGDFASGAVSHTFDDNMNTDPSKEEQKIYDQYGFHMTCFVQTGSVNWNNAKATFAKGHEIGNHTVSHTSDVSGMNDAQKAIKQNVPGEKCISIAYPNCNTPGDAEVLKTHVAGRNCDGKTASKSPSNFAQISSAMFGSGQGNYANDATSLNNFANQAASSQGWSVYTFHGIGTQTHSWATISMDAIKGHLSYLNTNRSKVWVETFGNVARYIKERDGAKVTVTSSDDKSIKLTLTDNQQDNTIFNYPLSLRCEMPAGWTKPSVTQNGKEVKDTIVTVNSKSYIMFQAVPDGGEIVLSATTTSIKEQRKLLETGKMISIDKNKLTINSAQFTGSNIAVSLIALTGKVIAQYTLNNSESGIALPSKKLGNETFFVKVSDGKKTYTEKVTSQL